MSNNPTSNPVEITVMFESSPTPHGVAALDSNEQDSIERTADLMRGLLQVPPDEVRPQK